ncbi:MAG: hypothetical protein ACRDJ2_09470 [Actinomycetota bacterium]|jgi:hypothetical protein
MHEVWHITILAATLFAAAGGAILLLAPLVFDSPPPGIAKYRPALLVAIGAAIVLVILEWTVVH